MSFSRDQNLENKGCPECGSTLECIRQGGSLVHRCHSASCGWGAVTSYLPPILRDGGRYILRVPATCDLSPSQWIVLNRKFTGSIVELRRLVAEAGLRVVEGSALEIWNESGSLRKASIPMEIEPPYPFDFDRPEMAFGPPDGPVDGPS
ncbi:hypothetical protein llg_17160 [Luteolibacter sp. LG18]|nr:hypothetical protein llg_17160 [Luteolibacter sp. LG18]